MAKLQRISQYSRIPGRKRHRSPDIFLRCCGLHRDFEGYSRRIDTGNMGEACIKKELFVSYAAGYKHYRNILFSCSLQDAEGQFSHERLAVCRAFASNHEVGIL